MPSKEFPTAAHLIEGWKQEDQALLDAANTGHATGSWDATTPREQLIHGPAKGTTRPVHTNVFGSHEPIEPQASEQLPQPAQPDQAPTGPKPHN